jgi:hypothetical protein
VVGQVGQLVIPSINNSHIALQTLVDQYSVGVEGHAEPFGPLLLATTDAVNGAALSNLRDEQ